ncbi:MAG: hypothetical protein C0407_13415 [Desulfobacca sp.]|nr:hypothetical protein [Desulfobacca sp.]
MLIEGPGKRSLPVFFTGCKKFQPSQRTQDPDYSLPNFFLCEFSRNLIPFLKIHPSPFPLVQTLQKVRP